LVEETGVPGENQRDEQHGPHHQKRWSTWTSPPKEMSNMDPTTKKDQGEPSCSRSEKTTDLPQVMHRCYHIMLYRVQLAWAGFELTLINIDICIYSYTIVRFSKPKEMINLDLTTKRDEQHGPHHQKRPGWTQLLAKLAFDRLSY
jgi:hypothetical protein